jgi:hypothetical protein
VMVHMVLIMVYFMRGTNLGLSMQNCFVAHDNLIVLLVGNLPVDISLVCFCH